MPEYKFSDRLFGGNIVIIIFDIEKSMADMIAKDTYTEALRLQKIFNLYDKDSELSLLNKKRKHSCSKELLEVIKNALEYCKLTDGKYDISLGKLFLKRKEGSKENPPNCSYKHIEIKGDIVTLTHKNVIIDLGSIAKGYIVDKLVEFMKDKGVESGLVDGRGDIRVFGDKEHIIDIQHPREKDKFISSIKIKDEAVATSGDYNQYKDSYNNSHIINNDQFASVTVVAKTLEKADVLATAITAIDMSKIESLIDKDNIKVVAIDRKLDKKLFNIKEL